jgi:HAAS
VTTAAHVPSEVETYLARVRAALADVPADERDDLLAEVEVSLHEAASETEGSVAAQLGPPEDFAAELRSAAGLHPSTTPVAAGLRETIDRLARHPRVSASLRFLRELAPIWWALRGYVAVAGLALAAVASWSISHEALPRVGNAKLGAVAILAAVAASIALGLWSRRTTQARLPVAFLNLVLLAAVIPVAVHLSHRAEPVSATRFVVQTNIIPSLAYNGAPVDNIYPYTRDGRLLHDVLLYSGTGAPLNVSTTAYDPLRRILVTKSGARIYNAFPVRYFEPGTRVVLRPNAGPKVKLPRIATPPLALPAQKHRGKAR